MLERGLAKAGAAETEELAKRTAPAAPRLEHGEAFRDWPRKRSRVKL
jgi:hypothetical protein